MTARDELFRAILDDQEATSVGMQEWANRFIDAYAHELAEKIRAFGCICGCSQLIDPEVGK